MKQNIFDVNPVKLDFLLHSIHEREVALPDFQRDFVWDPRATEELIESICRSFPAGSLLRIRNGAGFAFAPRAFAGAPELTKQGPSHLILDGQQRLTSLYQAFYGTGSHRYLIDLKALIDGSDLEDCVFFLRQKDAQKRYGTPEQQAESLVFPLADLFGGEHRFEGWLDRVLDRRPEDDAAKRALKQSLREQHDRWIAPIESYEFPMVTLSDSTSAEAVCTIFETLNRTGVKLSVFDLLGARFWVDEVRLRNLWDDARGKHTILDDFDLDPYYVLQAIAIHTAKAAPSCKRSDVLALNVAQIRSGWDPVIDGFAQALTLLRDECGVLVPQWMPYAAMMIPLAAVFAGSTAKGAAVGAMRQKLRRWFWCSVFNQTYDNPPNSQAVKDYAELKRWIDDDEMPPVAVFLFLFDSKVLRQTTPRQRALYRGVMALVLSHGARDFYRDERINAQKIREQQIDDHHVFPQAWLRDCGVPVSETLRDCVLNRTLIDRLTNIRIGMNAPSNYLAEIQQHMKPSALTEILDSHLLPSTTDGPLWKDDFEGLLAAREVALRARIAEVTG